MIFPFAISAKCAHLHICLPLKPRAAKNLRRGNRDTQETPALSPSFVCNYSDGCKGTDQLFFLYCSLSKTETQDLHDPKICQRLFKVKVKISSLLKLLIYWLSFFLFTFCHWVNRGCYQNVFAFI